MGILEVEPHETQGQVVLAAEALREVHRSLSTAGVHPLDVVPVVHEERLVVLVRLGQGRGRRAEKIRIEPN